MSTMSTESELLRAVATLSALHLTSASEPNVSISGTSQRSARVSGLAGERRVTFFLAFAEDGGLLLLVQLSSSQISYRAEILPEDAQMHVVARHAERGLARIAAQAAQSELAGV